VASWLPLVLSLAWCHTAQFNHAHSLQLASCLIQFRNYLCAYSLNCIPLGPIVLRTSDVMKIYFYTLEPFFGPYKQTFDCEQTQTANGLQMAQYTYKFCHAFGIVSGIIIMSSCSMVFIRVDSARVDKFENFWQ